MEQHETQEENLSHEEIMYRYHIQRGSDFTKIELFLSARNNYQMALKYNPGDTFAVGKVAECKEQIRKDRKKVLFVLPFIFAIIAWVVFLNV